MKLEINNRRETEKNPHKYVEIKQFTLNQWVKEVTRELRKCSVMNENTVYQNTQDTVTGSVQN